MIRATCDLCGKPDMIDFYFVRTREHTETEAAEVQFELCKVCLAALHDWIGDKGKA